MNGVPDLRRISAQDFIQFGLQDIAYIRQVVVNDTVAFALHAADGTQLGLMPNQEVAAAALRQHELEPLSVH